MNTMPSSPTSEKPCEPVIYSSTTPDIVDSATASINQNSNGNNNHHLQRRRSDDSFSSPRPEDDSLEMERDSRMVGNSFGRQSPEGKDNMIVLPREQMGKSTATMDQYSADSNNNNGKINVQVTVLFGELETLEIHKRVNWLLITRPITGTLADLKKHRAQSRFTQGAITNGNGNGSLTPSEVIAATTTTNGGGSIVAATTTTTNGYDDMDGQVTGKIPIELSLISTEDHYQSNGSAGGGSGTVNLGNGSTKFSGIITGDVVSDSTRSKRCCIVM